VAAGGRRGGGGGRAPAPQKTVLPLTCATLQHLKVSAANDGFVLADPDHQGHPVEVQMVRLAGRVLSVSDDFTRCAIALHDGTGQANIVHFTSEDDLYWPSIRPLIQCVRGACAAFARLCTDARAGARAPPRSPPRPSRPALPRPPLPARRQHTYIDVVANVRKAQDAPTVAEMLNLSTVSVKPIKDANAFTMHLLACMHTHAMITKGPLPPPGGAAGGGGAAAGSAFGGGGGAAWGGAASGSPAAAAAHAGGGRFADPNMEVVLSAFEACKDSGASEEGTSVAEVLALIKRQPTAAGRPVLSENDIRAAIQTLSMEGFLYSTVDDNHFRSTA